MARVKSQRSEEDRARLHEIVNRYALPLTLSAQPKRKEYIYVTKAPFGYKIGMTVRPKVRPFQVAGNAPVELELVVLLEVEDMKVAEKRLHDHFAGQWLRGEWFSLSEVDIEFIKNYPKSFDALPKPEGDEVPF